MHSTSTDLNSNKDKQPRHDLPAQINEADAIQFINDSFSDSQDGKVHSFYSCKNKECSNLSTNEIKRFSTKVDRFQHAWIMDNKLIYCEKTGYHWLIYEEGHGMYCFICRKHNMENARNKCKKFNLEPGVRFKRKAVEDHASSQQHKAAVMAELINRTSPFQAELDTKEQTKDSVYFNAFLAIYWLAKEELSNCKLSSFLEVLEQLGLTNMTYFLHRSAGSVREMFLELGHQIKLQVVENCRKANWFGLVCDEVCDLSNKEQLLTFIKYVDPQTHKATTDFLSASDLLENSHSADANTICTALNQQLENNKLEKSKLSSFASDGASVMTGKNNGVAAKLRSSNNKKLINIHCIAHRLALACGDANNSVSYILTVEKILIQLWSLFKNSAKKAAKYSKAVLNANGITMTKRGKKKLRKRFHKACRTRWLSTERAIQGVYNDFEALTQTLRQLQEENDSAAIGLLKQIANVKFLGAVYLLNETLPILSHLSKAFQKGAVSFAAIDPAIKFTLDELQAIADEDRPLKNLKKDLSEYGRLSQCDIQPLSVLDEQRLTTLTKAYVAALRDNINNRFDGSIEVLTAFKIFNPLAVPNKSDSTFKDYGIKDIGVMADHFYQDMEEEAKDEKKEELTCEWRKFKYNLLAIKNEIPDEVLHPPEKKNLITQTPTEWALEYLMKMRCSLQYLFPLLLEVAELCLSIPVSSAWPERGASCVKRIKTRLRSRLKNDMLESLLHIAINGPEVKDSAGLIQTCLKHWLHTKPRRNIKAIKEHSKAVEQRNYLVDASVQVSFSADDEREPGELDEELQIVDTDREADATARLLHFPTVEELDCSSDSDSDSDSDSASD